MVDAVFLGVKCAVIAIVIEALMRIAKRALVFRGAIATAGAAFVGIYLLSLPFPLIIGLAAIAGLAAAPRGSAREKLPVRPALRGHLTLVAATLAAWLGPVIVLFALLGPDNLFTRVAVFFSQVAMVTFGGAYAVLAYVADHAVQQQHWLTAAQMTDGLGLAETTPGPLILVLQFVAFLAGYGDGSKPHAVLAAIGTSVLAVWVLFLPSFLWIFAGAPLIDRINAHPGLRNALTFITAAVLGVILNLALWFAVHVMFAEVPRTHVGPFSFLWPEWSSFEVATVLPTLVAFGVLFGLRRGVVATLTASALAGLLSSVLPLP